MLVKAPAERPTATQLLCDGLEARAIMRQHARTAPRRRFSDSFLTADIHWRRHSSGDLEAPRSFEDTEPVASGTHAHPSLAWLVSPPISPPETLHPPPASMD
eukprot:4261262-Prymnesium_polylepis.1